MKNTVIAVSALLLTLGGTKSSAFEGLKMFETYLDVVECVRKPSTDMVFCTPKSNTEDDSATPTPPVNTTPPGSTTPPGNNRPGDLPTESYVLSDVTYDNDLYSLASGYIPTFMHDQEPIGPWSFNVIDDPAKAESGDLSERYELRTGDCNLAGCNRSPPWYRAESSAQWEFPMGTTRWYAWSMKIDENYEFPIDAASGTRITHHQQMTHNGLEYGNPDARWDPHFWVGVIKYRNVAWMAFIKPNQYGGDRKLIVPLEEVRGQWLYFVERIDWSTEPDGSYRLYMNGEKVVEYTNYATSKPGFDHIYQKWGIYRKSTRVEREEGNTYTQIVNFDNIRDGDTYEDIAY